MKGAEPVGSQGLQGHLDLVCGLDSRGGSSLRRQSFRAPIHLSKPHLEEETLVVNVVNPTAGLLSGDRITMRVHVEAGARLLLTAPSANRAHCARGGEAAVAQVFSVAAGGGLEFWPELFIPQAGARYRQETDVRVEEGGELLFFETLAPGRTASGEVFAYESLRWKTDVRHGGRLIARERYLLEPGGPAVESLRARFLSAYYASGFVLTPRLAEDSSCWRRIHDLHQEDAWVGCSALTAGGWSIKVVASGSVALRRTLSRIRTELYAAMNQREPLLRRVAPVG